MIIDELHALSISIRVAEHKKKEYSKMNWLENIKADLRPPVVPSSAVLLCDENH